MNISPDALGRSLRFLHPDMSSANEPVAWTGKGSQRVIVEVTPRDIGTRQQDELPAEIEINAQRLFHSAATIDVASLQVVRFDPRSGLPIRYAKDAYGKSDADRPFRWYDAAIPYHFPEFADEVSRTGGKLPRTPIVRGGYYYNAIGDWKRGRLAWLHTQDGDEPSHYAI